ncbi:MAG: ABC-2 family transporter protein [Bacilli bacterium]|nr:ABC-2 family transporter protein [Bacilli bacterium]
MKIYLNSLKLYFKSQLEYKKSFITGLLSQILIMFTYYFIIIALFDKFDNIKGYTKYEVLLCFAIIQFGFSITETFARGIDVFENLIIRGEFDRLLLRPKNILLQVLSSDYDLIKISRVIQAIIILIISLIKLNIKFNIYKIITISLILISSITIFFSIFLLMASYCFITVQGLEVKNLFTDGGKQIAQYPISIYNKHFIFIFTFLIPYAFVNYYPLLYLLGKSNNKIYVLSPLIVFIYLIPSILSFKWGIKKYTSVGS